MKVLNASAVSSFTLVIGALAALPLMAQEGLSTYPSNGDPGFNPFADMLTNWSAATANPSSTAFSVPITNTTVRALQPSPDPGRAIRLPVIPREPEIRVPVRNPDVPDWIYESMSKMSVRDYERAQRLSMDIRTLQRDLSAHPALDLVSSFTDMAGAMAGALAGKNTRSAAPPGLERFGSNQPRQFGGTGRSQEIVNNWSRLNSSKAELSQIRKKYEIPPDLLPASRVSDRGTQPFEWQPLSSDRVIGNGLSPLGRGHNSFSASSSTSTSRPGDLGGVSFRSVRWVYLSEGDLNQPGGDWQARSFASVLQAIPSESEPGLAIGAASQLAADAFYTFLQVPDRDLWVNLHPGEPNRIISDALAGTIVGRVMLEADFQLKRDAGSLMQQAPYADAERQLIEAIIRRAGFDAEHDVRWASAGRVEISSETGTIFARETDQAILIEGIIFDVTFEQQSLDVRVGNNGQTAIHVSDDDRNALDALKQHYVRTALIQRVNHAPEYESLRAVFSSRVLADWYKRKRHSGGTLSELIDTRRLEGLTLTDGWRPFNLWEAYKRDYERGAIDGFGGVTLRRLPAFRTLPSYPNEAVAQLRNVLGSAGGSWHRGVYREASVYLAMNAPSPWATGAQWLVISILLAVSVVTEYRKRRLSALRLLNMRQRNNR
jgi:hypothetical protein